MWKSTLLAILLVFFPALCESRVCHADQEREEMDAEVNEAVAKYRQGVLKKTNVRYRQDRRRLHATETEERYQLAMSLYRQGRLEEALSWFYNVQDFMADYKQTNAYITRLRVQIIERDRIDELERNELSARRLLLQWKLRKETGTLRVLSGLMGEYKPLYEKALHEKEEDSAGTNKNIIKIYESVHRAKIKQETAVRKVELSLCVVASLIRIKDKAEGFNQEVFRLIRSMEYDKANTKFLEFQAAMLVEFGRFDKALNRKRVAVDPTKTYLKPGELGLDKGYLQQEKEVMAQCVQLFNARDYRESRVCFIQLIGQGNHRAEDYIRKIDRILKAH